MRADGTRSPSQPSVHPIKWLTRALIIAGVAAGALLLGTAGLLLHSQTQPATIVTSAEAELIGVTLVFLALLSIYSAKSFALEADRIIGTQQAEMGEVRQSFREETTRLLERNAEHWKDQTAKLVDATTALREVVKLQSGSLDLTRTGIRLNEELLQLERERERVRTEELDVQRRRMQPLLGLNLEVPDALIKHMFVHVHNRGMDGRNLVLFFGAQTSQVLQYVAQGIAPQEVSKVDFGDIATWPPDANLAITCEVSDVMGNRYRYVAYREYHRNLSGGLVPTSSPTVAPGGWTYPDAQRT
jgi:hypothetical protein